MSDVTIDEMADVTIDEMADAITGGNDVGRWVLWPVNIPEQCRNIG